MLDRLTAEDFAPLTDSEFAVRLEDGSGIPLRLVEIGRYPRSGVGSRAEPFALVFEGLAAALLPQRIYHLEHPAMAAMDIFLVPVGRSGERIRYEAVFN
jgi:hypothetical protein